MVEGAPCGWLCLRPACLQRFRTPKWILFWLCCAGAMQGLVVNGLVNIVITTIEKRFGLRSSQTGLVAGGYDIASFFSIIPVTYFGGRQGASKPRWLGLGVALMGLGSLVFASPHFLAEPHEIISDSTSSFCLEEDAEGCGGGSASSQWVWVFLLAQLLHGAGAAPLYTLGVTFIDENVTKKMSSVYIGIFYTTAVLGPAFGYVLGGQMLRLYTDFMWKDIEEFGVKPGSSGWIGAWWLGFVISFVVCLLVACGLAGFPGSLPGSEKTRAAKDSEAHEGSSKAGGKVCALMANPAFLLLSLAGATEGLLMAGCAAFLPKLIENQFGLRASQAAVLMGLTVVGAGGGGTFLGGYLVKRLKLNCSQIILLCIGTCSVALLFTPGFLLACPGSRFAGVTAPYHQNLPTAGLTFEDDCNAACHCSQLLYEAVCSSQLTYYSPCYAGCASKIIDAEGFREYSNCSCLATGATVSGHTCGSTCGLLWAFVPLVFVTMLFAFLATTPALSATLRCVSDDQRTIGLGIQWILVRLFGTIPSPVMFGAVIDNSCLLWRSQCNGGGDCVLYDNSTMSRYTFALIFTVKLLSLLFFVLAWKFYVPPKQGDSSSSKPKRLDFAT